MWSEQVRGLRVGMDKGSFLGLWGDVQQTGTLQTTKHAELPTGALSTAGPAPAAATRVQLCRAGASPGEAGLVTHRKW